MKINEWHKRQQFSFRKLSVGLVSTAVASFWLTGAGTSLALAQEVSASQPLANLHYQYVTEEELTADERAAIVRALPDQRELGDSCYVMVYRPQDSAQALPRTGDGHALGMGLGLAGLGLLLVMVTYSKREKKWTTSLLVLGLSGTLLSGSHVEALKGQVLSAYNQEIQVGIGDKLPRPAVIDGYRYVGYLKVSCLADTHLPASNQDHQSQPIAEVTPSPKQEVSTHKLEAPTLKQEVPKPAVEELEKQTVQTAVPTLTPRVVDTESEQVDHVLDDFQPAAQVMVEESVQEEIVPFTEETVYSDDLYEGESSISEGQSGLRRIVTQIHRVGDTVLQTEEVSNELILAPVSRVVTIGRKSQPVQTAVPTLAPRVVDMESEQVEHALDDFQPTAQTTVEESVQEEIVSFTEETVYSDDLYEGESSISEGQSGLRRIVTRIHRVGDTVLQTEEVSNELVLAPVSRVVTIGRKSRSVQTAVPTLAPRVVDTESDQAVTLLDDFQPAVHVTVEEVETTENLPFSDQTVTDKDRYEDEAPLITDGVAGRLTIKTQVHKIGQEILKAEEIAREITLQPVDRVTVVGSKKRPEQPETIVVEESRTEVIPFETREIETDDLWEGESETLAGQEGIRTILIRRYMQGDALITEEEVSNQVTRDPQDQLIRVGTRVDKTALEIERQQEARTKLSDAYLYADQVKQQAYQQALLEAQAVLDDKKVRKAMVAAALERLEQARLALDGRLKEQPRLIIEQLEKDENGKKVSVTFAHTDPDKASVERKISLYKGEQLVKEVVVTEPSQPLELSELDYYEDYILKTSLLYDLGQGPVLEEVTDQKPFRLDYKKIELKDIDQLDLYHKEGESFKRKLTLDSLPADPSAYFIKIKSDRFKEALLPVKTIVDKGNTYELTVDENQLVQDQDSQYKDDFRLTITKPVKAAQVYTNFASLVEAMRQDPTGTFILGANMTADDLDLAATDQSYVPTEFRGTLKGDYQGQSFAIYDLKKPLFQSLNGATISQLDLKDVAIETNQTNTGALANEARKSQISNLAVQGQLTAKQGHIGGVIGLMHSGVQLSDTLFTGRIDVQANANSPYRVGGLAGKAAATSLEPADAILVRSSLVDAVITMSASNRIAMGSGLVGSANAMEIRDSYAKGSIHYAGKPNQKQQRLDGLVIIEYPFVQTPQSASEMTVTARDYEWVNPHSPEELAARAANFSTQASLDDTPSPFRNLYSVDYSQLPKASADRAIAYHNTEKLLPFYNKEYIVHQGNQIASSDKLYTTKLVDVLPMVDRRPVMDLFTEKMNINQLMLHYEDGTVTYLPVSYKEDFKNNQVVEYQINGQNLLYTPEAFVSSYESILDRVLPSLAAIDFHGSEVKAALRMTDKDKLSNLYLEQSFAAIKRNLADNVRKALAMNQSINSLQGVTADYLTKQLLDNPAEFLLGLAYLNRWYDIPFGDIQTKDLTTFKNDFFGNTDRKTVDTLISLGKSGFTSLQPRNNVATYKHVLGSDKGQATVFDLLEAYKERFLPNKTENEWLKETTRAYVVETPSGIEEVRNRQLAAEKGSLHSIGLYDRIKHPDFSNQNILLPLLALKDESVYVITNMTNISLGSYDRYLKDKLPEGKTPQEYVRDLVNRNAIWQRDHFDFWYKVLTPTSREKLFRSILTYDGYKFQNEGGGSSWRTAEAPESAIADFFGPSGLWYAEKPGAAAYATGNDTYFDTHRLLDQLGTATLTHEMVHNLDSDVYFEGHGRREGLGPELFALGLLQAPDTLNDQYLAINNFFTDEGDSQDRLQVANPHTRFTNAQDLKDYMHGVFDVVYLLDYMEAQSVLKQSKDVQKAWFRKIGNSISPTSYGQPGHATNTIAALSDQEVEQLTSWQDLIDQNIINRREYFDQATVARNDYYTISLFSPIYAALENPTGAPGDILFRRMAFELLAAKGYQEGFVPYVSQQLGDKALDQGSKTYSNWFRKDVGVVSDQMVFKHVFGEEYPSWAAFKKAMYEERINQLDRLKPIDIRYALGRNTSRTQTVSGYAAMQQLMDAAVSHDAKNLGSSLTARGSWVNVLKKRIFNAYLRNTDDFRSSIFN